MEYNKSFSLFADCCCIARKRNFILSAVIGIFSFLPGFSFAQESGKIYVDAVIIGADTVPVITLPPLAVEGKMDPDAIKALQKYLRLRNNVIKVLPYARMASAKLREINEFRATLKTERERKEYTKTEEKKLKKQSIVLKAEQKKRTGK